MTEIHSTAVIGHGAQLGEGVSVGPYCVVGQNVTVGAGTRLMSHVVLDGWTTIGRECVIFPFACIGTQTQDLKYRGDQAFVEVGDRTTLREYVTVHAGTRLGEVTRVGNDCHILAYSHIAHGCRVGNEVIMSNGVQLAGEVVVEDQVVFGGVQGVHQFTRIGRLCMLGGMSRISQDCPPYMIVVGNPAEVKGVNSVGMERRQIPEASQRQLKEAYRILYRSDLSTRQALERIRAELDMTPEVKHLVEFIEQSDRGIIK
jgi:UDP-N-acetylglucosamine acyltransferase